MLSSTFAFLMINDVQFWTVRRSEIYPRINHAPGGTRYSSSWQSPGGGWCPGGRSGYQIRHFPGGGMWPEGMSGGADLYAGGGGGAGGGGEPGSPQTTPKEQPLISRRPMRGTNNTFSCDLPGFPFTGFCLSYHYDMSYPVIVQ